MTALRRYVVPVGLVILALALAGLLAVLAADVWRSEARLRAGDVRFRITTTTREPWRLSRSLTSRVARDLLAIEDDLGFRHAAQLYRVTEGETGAGTSSLGSPDELRVEASVALERFERDHADDVRASKVANLLAIIAFASATDEPQHERLLIARSLHQFRRAIRLDNRNADAKYNLELLLRLLDIEDEIVGALPGQQSRVGEARGGRRGAGVSPEGHGY